ncbi:hypothetical protein [Geobacter sp.]|uniref:hypothetical protein n=1 Tax=Geobacter sp. TaxID=46610 RepID=UPI002624199A|nr:hypothetical protein [Geobacter sp.]
MKAGYSRRTPSPEESELERRRREFHALERRLAKLEHELDDLREEIGEFEKIYAEKMAIRLRELDQLKQELARVVAAAGSSGGEKQPGPRQCSAPGDGEQEREEIPRMQTGTAGREWSESIRDLYRKVAKAIHPDLAGSEEERKRRQKLMAEANRAYAAEDRVTLRAILEEWELSPEAALAVGTAGELALLTRRRARLEERLRSVEREIARLRNTEIYRLIQRVEEAKWRGRDIIADMAAKLDDDILALCRVLNRSRRGPGPETPAEPPLETAYRTVRFPGDRPLGTLFVRERASGNFLDWKRLGEAQGDVAVPAGKSLRLDIREGGAAAGIDLLASLAPDDLQACFLYGAGDDDLTHILRLAGLEELYLAGDGITGEGLLHLLELKRLERLYLYDTRVSDAGLVCLRHLPRLRSVTLCNAPVTDAGVNRLRLALPSCRVVTLQSGRR